MDTLLQKILNILIAPPGNLIYHLVMAFAVLAGLQTAIVTRRSGRYAHAGRLVFGLGMLLAGQVLLFFSSGLAWQGMLSPHLLLPPLDRAIWVFSLVWIVWLWCFSEPARLADLVTGFLNLVILILLLFTYTSWSAQGAESSFNNNWPDLIWELAAFIVVLTGMGILFFARPSGWGFGVGMLSLSLAGIVGHALLTPTSGDFSGILRLSQLAAFPLLPNLVHRLPLARPAPAPPPVSASTDRPTVLVERRRYSSDARTVRAFLQLAETEDPQEIGLAVARAIGHTLFADLTFVVALREFNQIVFYDGYDLIREDRITGASLDQSQFPVLTAALQSGKGLRITSADSQPADLQAIAAALGLKEPGTLMLLPLIADGQPWGGLLLLSPYAKRQWSADDQAYLASEMERIAQILIRAGQRAQGQPAAQPDASMLAEHRSLQAEIDELRTANFNLADALEAARNELDELRQKQRPSPTTSEIDALVALQKEAQEMIAALQSENEQLRAALGSRSVSAVEASRLEADLRATLKEMAHLQNQLAEANAKILVFERQAAQGAATGLNIQENWEVLISLVQEMRQPMASIAGYTDLLLSESVGILGALQHKFLERVRASTERMRSMLDDLVRLVVTGTGQIELLPQPIELGAVIDNAMLDTSAQLREKNITLRVDLPRELPKFHADRDAVQQIIVHLLQNAGAVTPPEGIITLRARVRSEADNIYLLLQVIDSGGGIQPEDLARVFAPRYRADSPLIQGLGDTGIGLSVVKALVEAHGGRIWVESEVGQTTTFSVLLPIRNHHVEAAVE